MKRKMSEIGSIIGEYKTLMINSKQPFAQIWSVVNEILHTLIEKIRFPFQLIRCIQPKQRMKHEWNKLHYS